MGHAKGAVAPLAVDFRLVKKQIRTAGGEGHVSRDGHGEESPGQVCKVESGDCRGVDTIGA